MSLLILPNAYGDAATNMAIDASLLESLPDGISIFRHYGWVEPSITFGYTQRFSEINALIPDGATVCRRLTGGGLVDHRNDWTYALILNSDAAAAQKPANALYEVIHQSLQRALKEQDIVSTLAPCPKACGEPAVATADQCFVQPVAFDVMNRDGRKIAGAAMKRTRRGLLVQGSIDRGALANDFAFDPFQIAFTKQLSADLELPIGQRDDLRELFDGPRIQSERARFQSTAWLERR